MGDDVDTVFYKICRVIIKFLFYVLYRPTVVGVENIPKSGRVVLAGTHTKWLDSPMLISVNKRQVHFLAKCELFKGPLKYFMNAIGCIPVNRKIRDKDSLIKAKEVLNNDCMIGIYPEGTINRTDDLIMPVKIGAVKMAHDTNSVIVPFVITGKYKLFRKSVKIEFLKARSISSDLDNENNELMKDIRVKVFEYREGISNEKR